MSVGKVEAITKTFDPRHVTPFLVEACNAEDMIALKVTLSIYMVMTSALKVTLSIYMVMTSALKVPLSIYIVMTSAVMAYMIVRGHGTLKA